MAKEENSNQASYEAYLNDLFVLAVSTHGTPEKSIDEILLETAISYERTVEEAKEDVKRILNVRNAVGVLLKTVLWHITSLLNQQNRLI